MLQIKNFACITPANHGVSVNHITYGQKIEIGKNKSTSGVPRDSFQKKNISIISHNTYSFIWIPEVGGKTGRKMRNQQLHAEPNSVELN